jgi:membrane peptidoglycan carboxypeptidase
MHYLSLAREGGTLPASPSLDRKQGVLHLPQSGGQTIDVDWGEGNRIDSIWRVTKTDRLPLPGITLAPLFLGSLENGQLVEYRPIDFDHISPAIKTTFLLSEDSRFFSSPALDFRGIGRAFFHDIRAHRFKEGGSTITQQVVKILFLNRKKSLARKVTEAAMALRMAALLSPEEIFELYLNHIDLGGYGTERIIGVEAASLRYFGRHANQLGWKEAATLATLVRAPTYYSPFMHPNRTLTLRNHILTLLYRHRLLNQKQWKSLMAAPIGMVEPKGLFHPLGPYFLDFVARQVRHTPLPLTPPSLHTTMDPLLQEEADRIVPHFLSQLEKRLPPKIRKSHPQALEAALVVMDPRSGAIRALVGGRDFATSPLDRASRSKRQPASLFKIVPYLTALTPHKNGPPQATLATVLSNKPMPTTFGHRIWNPHNDKYDAADSVLLYKALARSMNLPVLHLSSILEKIRMVDTAKKLGLETPGITRIPLSYPLGVVAQTPIEMATAYSRVANGGLGVIPHTLLRGSIPGEAMSSETPRLFPPGPVYLLWSGLKMVLDEGTGASFLNTHPDRDSWAGKTGTSNRGRDTWFVALSSREVVLAWVGFDDNSPTYRFGAQMALPIVSSLVAWQGKSIPPPPVPSDILFATIDTKSGSKGDPACGPSVTLPFISGTVPSESCLKNNPSPSENPILHFFRQFF